MIILKLAFKFNKKANENIENAKLDVIHGKEDCDKELEDFNNKMHDLFNNETERRKNLRKTTEEKEKQLQETLIASKGKLNEDFKKEKSQMNEQIDAARKVFNEDEATRKEEQNENTKTLEEKMNNEEETLKKEMEEMKKVGANGNPGREEELNKSTKKRDDAKYQFAHRPMREEEKNIIDNLNEIVDQKTKYLMLIGRDLLAYRARLLQQEGDINCRFGNDPIICNCNVKITAQSRPRTAIASPLHSNSRPMTATLVQTPKGKKTQRLSSLFQKTV